jgi:uncharacterized protein HemY
MEVFLFLLLLIVGLLSGNVFSQKQEDGMASYVSQAVLDFEACTLVTYNLKADEVSF